MKRVLITGAAGFLGSHLLFHHVEKGDCVLGLDNFCSSSPYSQHVEQINALYRQGLSVELINCDITDNERVKSSIIKFCHSYGFHKFDLIYNFACPASPPIYQKIPIETLMTCVLGTKNILDIAKQHDAIFVHASTSEVYGDPTTSPQNELYKGNVNSYGPRSCYDEGKRAAEALCFDYHNQREVDARLVRIFNTYGPRMDSRDGRVVSNFICQALKEEPLTIYGNGDQTRSFCYVDDLIRGIIKLGELDYNPKIPINLGNPNEFTIRELATLILKKIPSDNDDINITFKPLPIDDPLQRCPNISVARHLLDWEPKIMLDEGLDKTINYFKQSLLV